MARKAKKEGKKYSYMDTYGDLVTLLLCFFVLLFAMSTVDEQRYSAFAEALSRQFGSNPVPTMILPPNSDGEDDSSLAGFPDPSSDPSQGGLPPGQSVPDDFAQLYDAIQQFVDQNGLEGQISVEEGESGVVYIRLTSNLLFAGNAYEIQTSGKPYLDFLADCFSGVDDEIYQVRMYGHTASIPGSGVDDFILSGERAGNVMSYMANEAGYNPYKLNAQGFGRLYPIADNDTEAGRAANRRVDIIVIGNDAGKLLGGLTEAADIYFPGDDTQFYEGDLDDLPGSVMGDIPTGVTLDGYSDEELQAAVDAAASDAGRG